MKKSTNADLSSVFLTVLFIILGSVWLWWVVISLQQAFPGLIDDGTHITDGKSYAEEGFFYGVICSFKCFLAGHRFYEIQYALLGIYTILLGERLEFWYAANIFLGVISAGAISYSLYSETKNFWPSLLGGAIMLTSSPIAEALRANFGKAEAIMVALLALGLALWTYSGRSKYPLICLVGAVSLIVLGCVSKESGKIVGIALCLPWIASMIPSRHRPLISQPAKEYGKASLLELFFCGLSGILASYLVSIPTRNIQYLQSYFQLDFSLTHIKNTLSLYVFECPDVFLIFGILILLYTALLWIHGNRNRSVLLGAACLAGAAAYFVGLMGLQYHCQYYLYVPIFFLALSAGFGMAAISHYRHVLLSIIYAAFFLSRIYSIPYLFMVTRAQQLFDSVNYMAILRTSEPSHPVVYALDITEDSQLVQEWNYLRESFSKTKGIAVFYGAGSGFEAWYYQDMIRRQPASFRTHNGYAYWFGLETENTINLYEKGQKWRRQMPREGDYLTCRFGKVKVGYHYLRAVMPFQQDESSFLRLIDQKAIIPAGEVSKKEVLWEPYFPIRQDVIYGWKFYKVIRPLGYVLQSCTGDQWITRQTSIWIPKHSTYSEMKIEMDVPQGNTFPFKVYAESNGVKIAEISITSPGKENLSLLIHEDETIQLYSTSWFQPSKIGLGNDDRELSVRLMNIETIEKSF